jgi:hypothetical protein
MDFDYKEENKGSSDDMLVGEYPTVVDQGAFQLGFSSSRPGQNDKDSNPVITIIDRSGVHEIGVRWCCPNAPESDMQLMAAGLFPATFQNPKTAFTFQVLEEFHLDNLECNNETRYGLGRVECKQVEGTSGRARERKAHRGDFEGKRLDDISLSAHHAIYLLTFYCTTSSRQYRYNCK